MATEVFQPDRIRKITDSEACPGISLEAKRGDLVLAQRKGVIKIPLEVVSGFAREMCGMADVYGKEARR